VVFSGAPHLQENYAAILAYWSPLEVSAMHEGAQYCQNIRNEYMVSFSPDPAPGLQQDALLSDGLVLCVTGVRELVRGLDSEQFIEIEIPVSAQMLGPELDGFDSAEVEASGPSASTCESETSWTRPIRTSSPLPPSTPTCGTTATTTDTATACHHSTSAVASCFSGDHG